MKLICPVCGMRIEVEFIRFSRYGDWYLRHYDKDGIVWTWTELECSKMVSGIGECGFAPYDWLPIEVDDDYPPIINNFGDTVDAL